MATHYSDPTRADETYALPDVETFYMSEAEIQDVHRINGYADDDDKPYTGGTGWYYWFALPGCLPDSEPFGPYASEQDAIDAMRRTCDYGDTSEHPSLF